MVELLGPKIRGFECKFLDQGGSVDGFEQEHFPRLVVNYSNSAQVDLVAAQIGACQCHAEPFHSLHAVAVLFDVFDPQPALIIHHRRCLYWIHYRRREVLIFDYGPSPIQTPLSLTKVLEIAFPGCLEMIKNATMVDSLRVLLHHDGETLVTRNIEFNSDVKQIVNLDIDARSMVSRLLSALDLWSQLRSIYGIVGGRVKQH